MSNLLEILKEVQNFVYIGLIIWLLPV